MPVQSLCSFLNQAVFLLLSCMSSLYSMCVCACIYIYIYILYIYGTVINIPPASAGDMGSIPELRRFLWSRKWQPASAFLPRESHGQRSLVYSWWTTSIGLQIVWHVRTRACTFITATICVADSLWKVFENWMNKFSTTKRKMSRWVEETKIQLRQSKITSLTIRFCTEETSPPKHLVLRINRE